MLCYLSKWQEKNHWQINEEELGGQLVPIIEEMLPEPEKSRKQRIRVKQKSEAEENKSYGTGI